MKVQWCPFAFNNRKDKFPEGFPGAVWFCRSILFIEIAVDIAVDGEFIKGGDRAFDKQKRVECLAEQKLCHAFFCV